jgi:hypothetical protein
MRKSTVVGIVARPALRGTMRVRETRKRGREATALQLAGHIAVAVIATWGAAKLDDIIEERLSRPSPGGT